MAQQPRLSESLIIRALADATATRICRSVVKSLQGLRDRLSGDDTLLQTSWDEICVQQQFGESVYWDAYAETMRPFIEAAVERLLPFEQEALWLRTRQGEDWYCETEENREPYPVCLDDIYCFIERRTLAIANDWNNSRIERYRELQYQADN